MPRSSTPFTANLRATPDQETATSEQLDLLRIFLQEGEVSYKATGIHEKLSEKLNIRRGTWFAFQQMLVFLWLSQICPEKYRVSPSEKIDIIWHEFLLFTEEYQEFCMRVVGHMIHHRPFTSLNRAALTAIQPWVNSFDHAKQLVGRTIVLKDTFWSKHQSVTCSRCDRCCT